MEYITRNCPKCNGELRIPEDLTTCICMYCGETFDVQEKKEPVSRDNITDQEMAKKLEEEYKKSLENVHQLLGNYEELMNNFNRKNYKPSFEDYAMIGRSVLKPAEDYYDLSIQNKDSIITEVTKAILDSISDIVSNKSKHKRNEAFMHFRFFLTCYLVPMIRSLKFSLSEPLAESVVTTWNNQNPKSTFQKADFEQLMAGFIRKGLCFITTAVCETMNKQDDCYELTQFRKFRDSFMLQSEAGRKLVEEYYQIAPAIVTFINMEPDCNERYMEIWNKYLKDCLGDIEKNRLRSCEKRYARMVKSLKSKYYISD